MRAAGFVRMFRPRPLGDPDGGMALADHLRELRARLLRSVWRSWSSSGRAVLLRRPARPCPRPLQPGKKALGDDVETKAYIKGAAGPLLLQLKLSGIAALVRHQPLLALPDLGVHRARPPPARAQVVPGVRRDRRSAVHPRRGVGYYVLPKGLEVLIGFTPAELENLVEFGEYFSSSPGCCWSSGSRS